MSLRWTNHFPNSHLAKPMKKVPAQLLSSVYVTLVLRKNSVKPLTYLSVHQNQKDALRRVRDHVPNFRFSGRGPTQIHECDRFLISVHQRVVLD